MKWWLSGAVLIAVAVGRTGTAGAELEVAGVVGTHVSSANMAVGRGSGAPARSALGVAPVIGARLGMLVVPRLGGELEVTSAPAESAEGIRVNVMSLRAQALANLLLGRVRPFLLLGGAVAVPGMAPLEGYDRSLRPLLTAGTGVRVDVGSWWGLRADARIGMGSSIGDGVAFEREWLFALYGRFPAPPPPEERGQGPLIVDTDGDGVRDSLDKCPTAAGPVRNYGCPADSDRDRDGVLDKDDRCPDVAGTREHRGCADRDQDGVADVDDKCPAEAGIAALEGCPDRDSDGDGIVDRLDQCPGAPETVNQYQDQDGCPDEVPRPPEEFVARLDQITFEHNSAKLVPLALPVLDLAVEMLKSHPDLQLEIVGHTDSRGPEALNLKLSQERALAVRDYLVRGGIDVERMRAIGKGSLEPLDTSASPEASRKNRRVEFRFEGRDRR